MKPLLILIAGLLLACTSCDRNTPEQRVHRLLTDRTLTLATAESCTGGTIAARFTALPGASAYFLGGIVSYSNKSKDILLGVSPDSIAAYGVVSEQVVRLMAQGVQRVTGASHTIATTGIAGPTGGTTLQPVGTVWIAVATPTGVITQKILAKGNRNRIIRQAGTSAIEILEKELLAE